MFYMVIKTVTWALLSILTILWHIEEALIKFMMGCFMLVLRLASSPWIMIILLLLGSYVIWKLWMQRREDNMIISRRLRTPRTRLQSYRSGELSTRSFAHSSVSGSARDHQNSDEEITHPA